MKGYYFASTQPPTYPAGQAVTWNLLGLVGYIAHPSQEKVADSVLAHMLQSTRFDPEWLNMNQAVLGTYYQTASSYNDAAADFISQSYEDRQQVWDETAHDFSNVIQDMIDVYDPVTGLKYNVPSGYAYYWKCESYGSVNIIMTDVYASPSPSCTLLQVI
jgi:hypothetical protein